MDIDYTVTLKVNFLASQIIVIWDIYYSLLPLPPCIIFPPLKYVDWGMNELLLALFPWRHPGYTWVCGCVPFEVDAWLSYTKWLLWTQEIIQTAGKYIYSPQIIPTMGIESFRIKGQGIGRYRAKIFKILCVRVKKLKS